MVISISSIITESSDNLKAALAYASMLDWRVFPVGFKNKIPITRNGFHDASNDIDQIKKWFETNPDAGIGLPTGKVNNILVIDIDPRNNGHISFDRLTDEYSLIPHTVECLTGGGGNHIYLKYDERINKSMLKDYPGLDFQGNGKYVILPPSIHPNGKEYHWEESSKPVITPIPDMPIWLIDLLTNKSSDGRFKAKSTSHYLRISKGVEDGERTQSLTSLIGHLLARKIDYEVAFQLILAWNERNNPPIDQYEVKKTFENIMKRELEKR